VDFLQNGGDTKRNSLKIGHLEAKISFSRFSGAILEFDAVLDYWAEIKMAENVFQASIQHFATKNNSILDVCCHNGFFDESFLT
jgi:hypothetical protein